MQVARAHLRTPHVVSPAGFGLGYRPTSGRNVGFMAGLPRLDGLLHRIGASRPSTNDNKMGLVDAFGQPFDQDGVGSCTAESSCKASRITLVRRNLMPAGVEDFSQKIFYGVTRQFENAATIPSGQPLPTTLDDVGAEPADCIVTAQDVGVAAMLPTVGGRYNDVDTSNVGEIITLGDVETTRIEPGAHLVDVQSTDLPAQWQAQINVNIGGTIALFVDTTNFMGYNGSAPVQHIDLNDPDGGGHQITGPLYWYTSPSLGLIWGFGNSWGLWGMKGLGEITHTCLMTAIDAAIAWNVSLAPEGT